ncbi:DUF3443 domain-containing protein [Undibacterium sp. TJN25]|uniref:DUF3443 domain-containing protein n=1 Tax=Undibacterium sp. TJN25 TaxID=3413056 RepID=UPI003BF42B6A
MRSFASLPQQLKHFLVSRLSRGAGITGALAVASCLALTACGGGGGSAATTPTTPTTPVTPVTPTIVNSIPMTVDAGPAGDGSVINQPYVSVTICTPGTTSCQTIDHILVDTGSYGLRIIAPGILSSSLSLPSATTSAGATIGECVKFTSGYTWGSVKKADVQLGGEIASNLPINIIGDTSFATVPAACRNAANANLGTVASLGANGILGVGVFKEDCGTACASQARSDAYYSCSGSACTAITLPIAQQVSNPVASFPQDNNGVVLVLPSVPAGGVSTLTGSLIFGIGTQSNNAFASEIVYTTNNIGNFTTLYKGRTLTTSYLDSGSNGYFFADSSIAQCSSSVGFYCPPSTQSLSAVNTGANGTSGTVNFSVENVDALSPSVSAASIAGSSDSTTFDWGLPFFFGRRVFVAIENANTPKGVGPYWAY